jgi:hypothetical protein
MEHNNESIDDRRPGIATNIVEAVVALIVLLIGVVVIYGSLKLGAGWTSDGPGAGYFPFYIGLVLSISGTGILFQALLGNNKNTEVFVDREQLHRVLSVLIPIAVYILCIQFLGLYIASAIYIAVFMIVLGKFSWVKSILIALTVNVLFFLMFEMWFKVPLYKGKFDLLGFLGY